MKQLLNILIFLFFFLNASFSQSIVKGNVIDEVTNSPVKNAEVLLIGNSDSFYKTISDSLGTFKFEKAVQDSSSEFIIIVKKAGYLKGYERLSYPFSSGSIKISILRFKCYGNIQNFNFSYNSYILSDSARMNLMNLIEIIKLNQNTIFEIAVHQDYSEKDSTSLYRAKSIVDFLIENGVDKKMLKVNDFAFSKPYVVKKRESNYLGINEGIELTEQIINTVINKEKRDEARKLNRRVEFKVSKINN
ncbi:MAG: hypothetical protein U0W24_04515 [Bacteroidales bacterium]